MSGISAEEAARRLGVKLDTVYAYVSRGVLSSRRVAGSRRSVFDPAEVEVLARRGRPRRNSTPAAFDLIVETELTTIVGRQLRYRGREVCAMARTHSFEQTAQWLWTGSDEQPAMPWTAYHVELPELSEPRDRIRAAVVMSSAAEPMRSDLSTAAVTASTRALIASMVAAVPGRSQTRASRLVLAGTGRPVSGSIAGQLWPRLTDRRATPELVSALNAALVLLADHELASSTVAARAAASVRADPFSVVLAGLGPLAGRLHGSASGLVHRVIADAITHGPHEALTTALETHRHLPGFGHGLYPDGDPRGTLLLELIDSAAAGDPGLRAARALADAAKRHSNLQPNIDFALGTLATVARMPASAGETIFTIARTAGWVAHAIEEYSEPPLRFRARAIPRPRSGVSRQPSRSDPFDSVQRANPGGSLSFGLEERKSRISESLGSQS